ncbi:hypothetical protein AIOL_001343 [Candidatus Rhodobacter oscarellae]|uniref:Uncharacterized protein n=1 Tax=Candidatus Rhodobacter oscarellae TaxID=1675527 RepID=A0A0J9E0C8_9RHOB|nr:hypothetical protein [Candidatus Rhodobacter lobularis]KMW56391.1 hypothetical protein AIOL_001343 [Candidatus Rhodobacter lobularis]
MNDFNPARARLAESAIGNFANRFDSKSAGNLPNKVEDADLKKLMQLLQQWLNDASKTVSGNSADKKETAKTEGETPKSEADKSKTFGNMPDKLAEKWADRKTETKSGNSANPVATPRSAAKAETDAKSEIPADDFIGGMREILEQDLSSDEMMTMILQLLMSLLNGDKGNASNPAEAAKDKMGNKPNAKDAKASKTGNAANKKEEAVKETAAKGKGKAADTPEAPKAKGTDEGEAADKAADTKAPANGGSVDLKKADMLADKLGTTINRVLDPVAAAKLTAVQSELRTAISEDKLDAKTAQALEAKLEDIADDMDQQDVKKHVVYLADQIGSLATEGTTPTKAAEQGSDEEKAFFGELAQALTDIAAVAPSAELRKAIEEAVELLETAVNEGETPDAALLDQMIEKVSAVDSPEAEAVIDLLKDTKDAL